MSSMESSAIVLKDRKDTVKRETRNNFNPSPSPMNRFLGRTQLLLHIQKADETLEKEVQCLRRVGH